MGSARTTHTRSAPSPADPARADVVAVHFASTAHRHRYGVLTSDETDLKSVADAFSGDLIAALDEALRRHLAL